MAFEKSWLEDGKVAKGNQFTFPTAQASVPGTMNLSGLSDLWTVEALAQHHGSGLEVWGRV